MQRPQDGRYVKEPMAVMDTHICGYRRIEEDFLQDGLDYS